MRFSERTSFLVFGLLLAGICCPGGKARAQETGGSTLAVQAPESPVTVAYATAGLLEQGPDEELPDEPGAAMQQQAQDGAGAGAGTAPATNTKPPADPLSQGRQTKRILFLVPNFRAVSADTQLPPQTVKEKFKTAMLDSVDYSAFIFVAGQAGVAQWSNSYPEFGQGAKGYGRYYWHLLADSINENTWVEFIVPAALHQDTRYYTLGKGNLSKRLGYAFTRVVITRGDDGQREPNYSEILGAGAFAGIANLYYPSQERTFTKTYQRYFENLIIDGTVFVVKEIWPDVNNAIFHQKD